MILAALAAAFVAGVARCGFVPVLPALVAGAAAAVASLRAHGRVRAALLVAGALLLGAARSPHTGPAGPHDLAFYTKHTVTVTGVVQDEPDVRDTGTNYLVTVQTLTVRRRAQAVSGVLYLHTPLSVVLKYGESVTLKGYLRRTRLSGADAGMSFARVQDNGPAPAGWRAPLFALRDWIATGIDRWLPEPEAALMIAITIGAHSASLGGLQGPLTDTGLIHLVAISGLKVAMVAGTLYLLVRPIGSRLTGTLLASAGTLGYVLLTGATPSGLRSGIMWILIYTAAYLGRRTVAFVSLAVAGAFMVALDPGLLANIGFQLSVTGTAAIVLFAPHLARVFAVIPSPFRQSLSTTVAAQVGTLPIVLSGFKVLSLTAPLTNALVLPFVPFLIGAGFVLGCLQSASVAAGIAGALSYALLHVLIQFVQLASLVPAVKHSSSESFAAVWYAALGSVAAFRIRRVGWVVSGDVVARKREVVISLGAGFVLGLPLLAIPSQSGLRYLGTGEALLLRSGGHTVLIDGSPHPFGLLSALGDVLPYRDRDIDLIVDTDARAGNVTGLIAVLERYHVGAVLDTGVEYPSGTYARWRAALRSGHIPAYTLRTGVVLHVGAVTLSALAPDGLRAGALDSAGILRLDGQGLHLVSVGAASVREQHETVFAGANLRADELIANGPVDPAFAAAVHPRHLISLTKVTSERTLWDGPRGR